MNKLITTFLYVGLVPVAPGTFGSLVGLALAYLFVSRIDIIFFITITIVIFCVGIYYTRLYLIENVSKKDPPEIVIDEVVGQWVTITGPIAFFSYFNIQNVFTSYEFWILSFFLFRVFDIWKPWPVSWADRQESALGIMFDDILAGLYGAMTSILLIVFFPDIFFNQAVKIGS